MFIMCYRNQFPDKSAAHLIQDKQTGELLFLNRFDKINKTIVNDKISTVIRPYIIFRLGQ